MITIEKNLYALHTRHTSYVFCVMESGHPEHLYYGRRIVFKNLRSNGNRIIIDNICIAPPKVLNSV
jgi:alpha-galactosidase